MDFLAAHWLDILTTILGLAYVALEYRASIALWIVGIIMPALDVYLYYSHGLYGDAGMAVYYTVAAVYGYAAWKFGNKGNKKDGEMPITHFPGKLVLPAFIFFAAAMWATYYVLANYTNYIEQWFVWIVVDIISCYLYIDKGIPFKAGLYGLYVVIAVMGYMKWRKMMQARQ